MLRLGLVYSRKGKIMVEDLELAERLNTKSIVVAKTPEEMGVAQQKMIDWAQLRIEACKNEIRDLDANLTIAKNSKWATKPWKSRIARETKRLHFYEKVKASMIHSILTELSLENLINDQETS